MPMQFFHPAFYQPPMMVSQLPANDEPVQNPNFHDESGNELPLDHIEVVDPSDEPPEEKKDESLDTTANKHMF
jgi:hypothetical protein